MHLKRSAILLLAPVLLAGCASPRPGTPEPRKGDEMVVAGQFFHIGAPVVLWMDPGGYDAYRVERRFAPYAESDYSSSIPALAAGGGSHKPNRYDIRDVSLDSNQLERVRGGGWDLATLQTVVDQFVLHYDIAGTSRNCFRTLQDERNLSVHFMLDLDGTIYQTLDLKERARQATKANPRSVGVEIASVPGRVSEWYIKQPDGRTILTIPPRFGANPERTPNFVGRPVRRDPVTNEVQGRMARQYDFTPQQYASLVKLTAALCTIFPRITPDYPRNEDGTLMNHVLPNEMYNNYHGVLGHYHVQLNKPDPGPALQWDYVLGEARRMMKLPPQRTVDGKTVSRRPDLIDDN